ncbi:MAG: penicillin-binding protein 2 [Gammaproteobacteria bacterium]|jgi:cell division protein FtsI (penicillin-binding protein 3)|nr:penicillin-binding protein 2 [Gammaproteobacteria bacterium]
MRQEQTIVTYPARRWLILTVFLAATSCLLWRAFDLQISNQDFLRDHGDARSLRTVSIPAHRGLITDRNGEPLAVSTPVESIWAIPRELLQSGRDLVALAAALEMSSSSLNDLLQSRMHREFVYLKRQTQPKLAREIEELKLPGVYMQHEYKRFYPSGEITSHLLGFTNVDDKGQEGLELAFDDWLQGSLGSKRVLKDLLGRVVADVESIQQVSPGKPLSLSIDRRIQYLAYRELKAAVTLHSARAGMLVMLDVNTGEVMAMVNQPSYNPNNRSGLTSDRFRNRAITDVFEPGSTLKPFTIAAALQSHLYDDTSQIETSPGYLKVNDHTIKDHKNYGSLNLTNILKKSSNVGASKIALSLGPELIWQIYSNIGFGQSTGSGFPGESSGLLNDYNNWSEVELATMSFGHGIAVTALQLAQAYSVLATGGVLRPISFQKVEEPVAGKQVLPLEVVKNINRMLETVVQEGGTGLKAAVNGYRVAGKTGTAHKAIAGGYAEDRYMSVFAGLAPVSNPQLVIVVAIDEPQEGEHYGGAVAGPVFSGVMQGALRILNIAPDDLPAIESKIVVANNENPSAKVLWQ